jgi:hypothetical protein
MTGHGGDSCHLYSQRSTNDTVYQLYQLIGAHGTCGSERQYRLLLQQLHRKLCALSQSSLTVAIDCLV